MGPYESISYTVNGVEAHLVVSLSLIKFNYKFIDLETNLRDLELQMMSCKPKTPIGQDSPSTNESPEFT